VPVPVHDTTKLEGDILARLGQAALWRAAYLMLVPLIKHAKVTAAERKRGLAPVPCGRTEEDLVLVEHATLEKVAVALTALRTAGKIVSYSPEGGGLAWRLTTALPHASLNDAARIARLLLAERRWPADKIEDVVRALTKGEHAPVGKPEDE
jgi:hypothetical protein